MLIAAEVAWGRRRGSDSQVPALRRSGMGIGRARDTWPAAARTSASVRPPAKAWLMNVCRPWWMVSDLRRDGPRILHAVRKRRRMAWRCWGRPDRLAWTEQMAKSLPPAPICCRSANPGSQIRERSGVPPQRHHAGLLALGRDPAQSQMRPWSIEDHVVDQQLGDLRDTKAAAARQPQDDEVAASVGAAAGLLPGVGEDEGEFAAGQHASGVEVPGGVVVYASSEVVMARRERGARRAARSSVTSLGAECKDK